MSEFERAVDALLGSTVAEKGHATVHNKGQKMLVAKSAIVNSWMKS